MLLALVVIFSVTAISASEINVTDSYSTEIDESISLNSDDSAQGSYESNVDNDTSEDVLGSENSNTLSTNTEESNVLTSDGNGSSNSTIDVSKTITSKDVTKYYKGSAKYTATFLDSYGNALSNVDVKITVNGKSYTKRTDSNGKISMDINLKPGSYKVVATNPKTGYSLTTTFKILSTITSTDISKVYLDGRKFTATFLKSNGKVLANKKVKFKINGKKYTVKTNSKGKASLSLTSLKKGTYKITSYNTDGLTKVNTVKVVKSTKTSLTASDYTFLKSDSKTIKVKLLNKFGYAPPKGKVVKFKVNGKTYKATTNAKGIAKLKLPSLKAGVYTVKYTFSKSGYYKASSTTSKVTIIPSKTPKFVVKSTTSFGYGAGTQFKVALQSGSVPLANKQVTLTLNGTTYTKTTDSQGMISLPIGLEIGKYTITCKNKAESKISSISKSIAITVKERTPSKLTWASASSVKQGTQTVSVKLTDSANRAISGQTVKLTYNSKTYSATTSNGIAKFSFELRPGTQTLTYSYNGDNDNLATTNGTNISVTKVTTMSLSNILTASNNVKKYIEANNKIPTTVVVGGITFTTPEFLYMMSQAIKELGNSKTNDVSVLHDVSGPSSPSGDDINKDLTKENYLKLAANIVTYISTNKQAPNYGSSAIGKIIYSELIDSFSRILAFYKTNKRLPSYVTFKTSSTSSQSGTGLNEKNTDTNLAKYLKSTMNCQVGNAKIKDVVNSLIKGLSSDSAKAKAIFNYVRDNTAYSFYYNTKYGAVGTLTAKKGNCVDHTHLLVAMFRTANLPARYVHGSCTFSSGSTYGHVWAQVLIDGKWTIADATSSRNSLGSVANWNTKSFHLNGIYIGLEF